MPLNACGWSSDEDERLVELVEPHSYLYNVQDPSRKNILARALTWQDIAQDLGKPVEECKKRWRGLRDGYMRSKRMGSLHKTKIEIFEKLKFLDTTLADNGEEMMELNSEEHIPEESKNFIQEEQVITDNQEYYEITVVEGPQDTNLSPFIKMLPKVVKEEPKKIIKRNCGRKKSIPLPKNSAPIKILPKPIVLQNSPNILRYVEDNKAPEQRSQTIDNLIEKILKENTNEIDVFFRSMAASVKKLQPNLIPKVKMEVCNVIAKYEMQSFDKNLNMG